MTSEPTLNCGTVRRTYPEFADRVARIASGLAARGVGPRDSVAVLLRNRVEYLEAVHGALRAGADPVLVNWHGTADEVGYVVRDAACRLAFTSTDRRAALPDDLPVIELAAGAEPSVFEGWLRGQEPLDELDVQGSVQFYSSGTTGRPKGVVRAPMSPDALARGLPTFLQMLGMAPGMRTLVTAPLHHLAPIGQANLALALGLDLTIMPEFDPEEFLRLVETHRVSHAQLVPTMFHRLLRLPAGVRARYDLSSLVSVVHGAAPCPEPVKREMIEWWGPVIREYYGSTEMSAITSCDAAEWLSHPGTVGRPLGDAAVRILDEAGREVPTGQTGLVYARQLTALPDFTYRGHPEARRAMDRDGFVHVGDIGHVDAEGYLYLTDRSADIVIRGGVNIYPAEVEACLLTLDGVRDVAVVGVPDEEYGEVLAAHVDADPAAGLTADQVRAHVRGSLAAFKTPRYVVFDDDLPREPTGKLLRRRVRDRYLTSA